MAPGAGAAQSAVDDQAASTAENGKSQSDGPEGKAQSADKNAEKHTSGAKALSHPLGAGAKTKTPANQPSKGSQNSAAKGKNLKTSRNDGSQDSSEAEVRRIEGQSCKRKSCEGQSGKGQEARRGPTHRSECRASTSLLIQPAQLRLRANDRMSQRQDNLIVVLDIGRRVDPRSCSRRERRRVALSRTRRGALRRDAQRAHQRTRPRGQSGEGC